MATLCKNCSHALVFDPKSQLLVCSSCGSSFKAEEVESEAKEYRQDLKAESLNDIYGTKDEKFMDCYVYTCSECGGEIIINGSEASTACVYCGNPNVVFSRIARQRCPEYIIPFSVTKERAIELVHEKIGKGFFVPKKVKNFSPDCVRGIYIPYWIVNAEMTNAVIVKGTVYRGKNSHYEYFGRAGSLKLKNFPIDASHALSDESSAKLEPFDLTHLKPFDEDYLAGFYSNVSDVSYKELREAVFKRAEELFNEDAMNNVRADKLHITDSMPSLRIDNDMVYAMMPAWFITFRHGEKHNTILVNGDTGKVTGGIPFNKTLFFILLIAIGLIGSVAAYFAIMILSPLLLRVLVYIGVAIVALFTTGIGKLVRVFKNINLTQDRDMFTFMKKRQE